MKKGAANHPVAAILFLLLTAGCNARQEGFVTPEQAASLGQQVKVYQPSELANLKYTSLGGIDADACRWMAWDATPSEQGVINQLLSKASQMNANGIANVKCQSGTAAALVKDCWSRVACTADAIKVGGSATHGD